MEEEMPMDENQMILEMLQAVMGRWQQNEVQLAGEKQALVQTLAQLAGLGGPGMGGAEGGMPMPPAEPMPGAEVPAEQVPMGMM